MKLPDSLLEYKELILWTITFVFGCKGLDTIYK